MPTAPPPPKTRPKSPPPPKSSLAENRAAMAAQSPIEFVTGTADIVAPPRIVINGVEGIGKTSLGACTPHPVIIMDANETGYLTLLKAGRVPDVPRFVSSSWSETRAAIDAVIADPKGRKTLVLDALSGFETQCHSHICKTEFKGKWDDFAAYGKGHARCGTEFVAFISQLDRAHCAGLTVMLLSHAKIEKFGNPEGDDYDRYNADCHKRTWGPINKWADLVGFVNFHTVYDEKKQVGVGNTTRVMYAERRAAFDAKNRYGMAESFDLPNDPAGMWPAIAAQIGE